MMAVWLIGNALAGPTHALVEAATWSPVTTARHDATGEIAIEKARVGGVDCFRGSGVIPVMSTHTLVETAIDVKGAVHYSDAGLTDGRILSRTGDRITYFQFLDVPDLTMASDRYWFLEGRLEQHEGAAHFRWDRLGPSGPHAPLRAQIQAEHPSAVEPPVNLGAWHFERSGDQVRIRYVLCSDSGGSLPRWMQNVGTRKTLPNTIGDVVAEARRREG